MINWLDEVGAPAVVTAANLAARNSSLMIGGMPVADITTYSLAALGYVGGGVLNWGGNKYNGFVRNLGVAAAPLAMEKLYNMVRGHPAAGMGRIARYPAPAPQAPFQGVRLT